MFKLIGIIIGAGSVILISVALLDVSQAKKITSQLHNELNQTIDKVSQQANDIAQKPISQTSANVVSGNQTEPALNLKSIQNSKTKKFTHLLDITTTALDHKSYNFWKPFTSLQSAKGFATRLTKQTQLTITVLTTEHGQYITTFTYSDEEDKSRILQLIQNKTGLRVLK